MVTNEQEGWDPIFANLTLSHVCACPEPLPGFLMPYGSII